MTYRTLEEWNNKDRVVKKGEKSHLRCPETKQALFHKKQTRKAEYHIPSDHGGYYYEDEYSDWDDRDFTVCDYYS